MTTASPPDSPPVPTFVAVGHVTHDLVEGTTIPGGAAYYASRTVNGLGVRVGALTSLGADFAHHDALDSIALRSTPAETTTCFENHYEQGRRTQRLNGLAAPLDPSHLPDGWQKAEVVYLCPVMAEVNLEIARAFPDATVGIGAQGWMRASEPSGLVRPKQWRPDPEHLTRIRLAVPSDEDTAADPEMVDYLKAHVPMVAYTHGADGCELFIKDKAATPGTPGTPGTSHHVPAFPTRQVGPTGAGDVFGGAMLAALNWGFGPLDAAYLASCAASIVVEAVGGRALDRIGETWDRLRAYGHMHGLPVRTHRD